MSIIWDISEPIPPAEEQLLALTAWALGRSPHLTEGEKDEKFAQLCAYWEIGPMDMDSYHYDGDLLEQSPIAFCYRHETSYQSGTGCPACRLEARETCRKVFAESRILRTLFGWGIVIGFALMVGFGLLR